jgi:Ca2+-binding EF-hand superfamily protein
MRGREGGMPPQMNPIFAALDTNGDGVIDEQEMANAPAALKKLDRNGDGKLTEDEVRPQFGRGGPGGPGGPGGRGGPGPGAVNVDEIVARMLQFDKNADGKLSKDELPERMVGMMERGDTNHDGFLTRDELVVLARAQAQPQGRGEGRGERDGERR